ncbi:FG-nucleoporin nsp1 [Coemansia sp. RSA 2618]|nr:FG-nucleoporin nsp1 [Coemansia sp. RSA 2618]
MFNAANNGNKGGGFSFGTSGTSSTSTGGFGLGTGGGSSLFGTQSTAKSEAPKTGGGFSFGASTSGGTGAFGSTSGGTGMFGSTSGGTGMFGSTTTTTTAAASSEAPKTGGFSFGGGAAGASAETPKAAGGFGLASTGGGLFGASKPEAAKPAFSLSTPASTAAAPAATTSSFGALGSGTSLFGAKPAAAPTTTAAAPTFGGFGATSTAAPAASAAATTATAATGFGFGSAATPSTAAGGSKPLTFGAVSSSAAETKADAAPASSALAANPTSGTGLGGFKLSTAPAVSSSGTPAADAKDKQPDSLAASKPAGENATDLANAALRGKTLEEIAQLWTAELATQTRAFHTQASTVRYWDRALVQQGAKITALYEATMGVEAEQAALDQSLEHMEAQQSALAALLDTYEGRVQDIVRKTTVPKPAARGVAMTADQERDHVYSSAERLNQQLDELARRLTTLVEDVNEISTAAPVPGDDALRGADPFAQIVEILNAHLSSLEWVDAQTAQLHERVKHAQRVYQDVAAAQSSGPGSFDDVHASEQREVLTIPGAFVSEPAPPVTSSFGTPMTTRKNVSMARSALGSASFAGTPRGY